MIYNQDNAIMCFVDLLNKKDLKAKVVAEVNKGRHKIVETEEGERYYCIYKREFFNTFGIHFKSFMDQNENFEGLGETLNKESLDLASEYNATTLVFIHPDAIYTIYTAQFRNFAMKNNLQRKQKKENYYKHMGNIVVPTNELTYSVPKEILKVLE